MDITLLPPDLLLAVFSYLPIRNFPTTFLVSRSFASLSSDELFWRQIYTSRFGHLDYLLLPAEVFLPPRECVRLVHRRIQFSRHDPIFFEVTQQSTSPDHAPFGEEFAGKFVLIGESGVGKTSLILQYTRPRHQEVLNPNPPPRSVSLGADFVERRLVVDELFRRRKVSEEPQKAIQRILVARLWDTPPAMRQRIGPRAPMMPFFYRRISGIGCVFDLTNRKSFDEIKWWLDDLRSSGTFDFDRDVDGNIRIPVLLIGNKKDLVGTENQVVVSVDEIEALIEEQRPLIEGYVETSATTGEGVREAMEWMFVKALDGFFRRCEAFGVPQDDFVPLILGGGPPPPRGSGFCWGDDTCAVV